MKRSHIGCLFLLVTFLLVSLASAEQLQKKEFSIVQPDGWAEIPREVLDQVEEATAKAFPTCPVLHSDYGFQLQNTRQLEYPYILIQVKHTGRFPQQELDRLAGEGKTVDELSSGTQSSKSKDAILQTLNPTASDINVGKVVYDKQSGILWIRNVLTMTNGIVVCNLIGTIPTEDGFIRVTCISLSNDYATYEPIFKSIATSVIPIPSLAYKPRPSDGWKWGKVILDGAVKAIMMCGVLAIFLAIGSLLRKKRRKKEPPNDKASDWSVASKGQTKRKQNEMKITEYSTQEAILSQEEIQEAIDVEPAFWLSPQYIGSPAQDTMSQDKMILKEKAPEAVLKRLSENENHTPPHNTRTDISRIEGAKDIKDNSDAFRRLQEELQRGRPEALRLQEELQRVRQEADVYIQSPAQDTISRETEDFEADLQFLSENQHVIAKHIREWRLENPGEELTDEITYNVIRRLRYQSEIDSYENKIRELKQRH